jgi:hypothetical protein
MPDAMPHAVRSEFAASTAPGAEQGHAKITTIASPVRFTANSVLMSCGVLKYRTV